jgi:pyruvate/2-oxoglutarate dehydrogenase complex dihydrolipoamide dehydrogenase (E3) component
VWLSWVVTAPGSDQTQQFDVAVVGAGPAGLFAALRAARLGARTALITRDAVGGMAAADGPVPVRVLTQAARLRREARQFHAFGIDGGETTLDYGRLLDRVRDVVTEVSQTSTMQPELEEEGVTIFDHAGTARGSSTPTPSKPTTACGCKQTRSSCAEAAPTVCCRCPERTCSARITTRGH